MLKILQHGSLKFNFGALFSAKNPENGWQVLNVDIMQEISKISNTGLVNFLLTKIPEFKAKSSQIEDESAYPHFGDFALFLLDIIEEGTNDELIDRSFNLLNDLTNLDDANINTMLRVEVFELLAENKKSFPLSREKLDGSALKLFENVSKFLETGLMPSSW